MSYSNKTIVVILLTSVVSSLTLVPSVHAEDTFFDALTGGDVSFSARLRNESVDQDNALKDADAVTVRTTLGYKTGAFHGFKGFIEFVDIPENTELVAIVNEEGLVYGLPYNAMASYLLDRSIVGDCIIIKENQA